MFLGLSEVGGWKREEEVDTSSVGGGGLGLGLGMDPTRAKQRTRRVKHRPGPPLRSPQSAMRSLQSALCRNPPEQKARIQSWVYLQMSIFTQTFRTLALDILECGCEICVV